MGLVSCQIKNCLRLNGSLDARESSEHYEASHEEGRLIRMSLKVMAVTAGTGQARERAARKAQFNPVWDSRAARELMKNAGVSGTG